MVARRGRGWMAAAAAASRASATEAVAATVKVSPAVGAREVMEEEAAAVTAAVARP